MSGDPFRDAIHQAMAVAFMAAAVWAVASLVLGLVIGRWIATPEQVDECPCGLCVQAREFWE